MSDTVKFDADKCVNSFASAVGNGAKMTEHFVAALNYVIAERDTTVITRLYQRTKARKDDKIAKAFRADKDTPAFDAQKAAERFIKSHPTSNELEAMIAALQAKRSEAKPNEAVVDTRMVEAPHVPVVPQSAPTMHFAAA